MSARLLNNLKYAAAYPIFIAAFIVTSIPAAQAETLMLFRSPDATAPVTGVSPRIIQQNVLLKLDEKGDLLIKCGNARFTVAYNEPADQFKPSGQFLKQQREPTAAINGISLVASMSF